MKRLHEASNKKPVCFTCSSCVTRSIQWPCQERDIIALQDKFLTNGIQHIRVKDVSTGRSLIDAFLSSLNYYHDIAVLTASEIPLKKDTFDMYTELLRLGYIAQNADDMDEFFFDQFYFDFMWVEATKKLLDSGWFTDFEAKLIELKIDKHIPIVVLSYTK